MISAITTFGVAPHQSTAANDGLALIAVLAFLALVIQKEATDSGRRSSWEHDLARGLNIGIVPLGLASCLIIGVRLLQALQ